MIAGTRDIKTQCLLQTQACCSAVLFNDYIDCHPRFLREVVYHAELGFGHKSGGRVEVVADSSLCSFDIRSAAGAGRNSFTLEKPVEKTI